MSNYVWAKVKNSNKLVGMRLLESGVRGYIFNSTQRVEDLCVLCQPTDSYGEIKPVLIEDLEEVDIGL